MATVYDVAPGEFINALAEKLKKIPEFAMPSWADFVKTSVSKERPPFEEDWWFKRSASILRNFYIRGVVGVGRLRTKYGSKKDRGVKPSKFFKGSGKIIRIILQQAEKAGFVEKVQDKKSGRKLTKEGQAFLDGLAGEKAKNE